MTKFDIGDFLVRYEVPNCVVNGIYEVIDVYMDSYMLMKRVPHGSGPYRLNYKWVDERFKLCKNAKLLYGDKLCIK